jgi:parallel beta-helix repeat protein
MASPLTAVKFHSTLASGADNAAGRVYTYAAGTTTPQVTYTTPSAGTPNANPVILDGTGRASIYLDQSLSYKFVCQDSAGASVPDGTVDNWTTGAASVQYTASLTVAQKLGQFIDVADYGAAPANTAAQNMVAILLALTDCAAGQTLYFSKPGLYKVEASVVDAAIVLPIGVDLEMAPGAWLTADTSFGSFIAPLGRNRIRANIDGAGYPSSGGVPGTWGIENVGIRAYFSVPIGLGATDVTIEGCNIKNVTYPVLSHGAQRWNITENRFTRYKQTGCLMGFSSGYNSTGNLICGNHFDDAGDYAVSFYQVGGYSAGVGSYNITAFNHAKDMNQRTNGYAFGVEQGVAANQHHFTFYGNTYTTAGSVTVTVGGVTISTCTDSVAAMNVLACPTRTQAKGINCVSSVNCTISGNTLDGWTDTAIDTDGSDGVTIEGNTIRDCGGASPTYPAVRLAAVLDTSNIRFISNTVTISPAYALSGSTVAAVLCLAAASKTVKNIAIKGGVFTSPNDRCVSIEGTSGIPIVNVEVSGLTVNGIGSATFFRREVAYLSYVNDLTVIDNVVFDAIRGIAAVNCVGGLIASNEFKGSQTITTLYDITGSTGLRINDDVVTAPVTTAITPTARLAAAFTNYAQRCSSIITEAQGSTAAIATGATVTHGMFAAPTQVSLTPNAAAVACAVTAKGATTFTVAFAGGGTQTFDWQAVIR